jgi:hypothetical protein
LRTAASLLRQRLRRILPPAAARCRARCARHQPGDEDGGDEDGGDEDGDKADSDKADGGKSDSFESSEQAVNQMQTSFYFIPKKGGAR